MKITAQEVQKVAELARLDLDDSQVDHLAEQLAAILEYMDKLSEVDTSDIDPTAHAIELTNAFREDAVHEHLDREKSLANAPQSEEGSFVVPKII